MKVEQSKGQGIWILAVALGLAVFCVFAYQHLTLNHHVRRDLNSMLGPQAQAAPFPYKPFPHPPAPQHRSEPFQSESSGSVFDDLLTLSDSPLFDLGHMAQAMPTVQIVETPKTYDVIVPLADPNDEKSVTIEVKPHHIQVAGQLTLVSPNGKQVLGQSSFMKSMTLSEEVLPASMRREIKNRQLHVTLLKKHPGRRAPSPVPEKLQTPPSGTAPTLPQQLEEELQNQPKSFI
jgi:HSP20 family molecular chaperone IbpA